MIGVWVNDSLTVTEEQSKAGAGLLISSLHVIPREKNPVQKLS